MHNLVLYCVLLDPRQQLEGSFKIGSVVLPYVLLSVLSSFCLSRRFMISFFLNFSMVLETRMKLCVTAGFSGKIFLRQKLTKNGPKTGFFEFIEKFGHQFLLNLFYNQNLYFLCSCTNPIFEKTFVPEIWTKMFSANQIAGFFNQPYLQNKSMKQPMIFCMLIQVHIN